MCSRLDIDVFFGLHSLMQAVRPAAAFHDTASLLVNDLNFVVYDHIVNVFFKERVCLQQLLDGVDTV